MAVRSPSQSALMDAATAARIWGLKTGEASHQYIGGSTLRKHHAIAFPNIYQYCLTEARLQDESKDGSMTIITFLLADPDMCQTSQALSTATVPPQSSFDIREAVEESLDVRIPNELVDKIMAYVDNLFSPEEAIRYTDCMKGERERFWTVHDERWFSLPFMCW